MSLKSQVEQDLKAAIRSQRKDEIRTLRDIKSLILLAETEKGAGGSLSEEQELSLLSKAAKQRRESAEIFQTQGRQDLADKELNELDTIQNYLPEPMDESELNQYLKELIIQLDAKEPKDMGRVMGAANQKLKGRADGATIARIVKSKLSGG